MKDNRKALLPPVDLGEFRKIAMQVKTVTPFSSEEERIQCVDDLVEDYKILLNKQGRGWFYS